MIDRKDNSNMHKKNKNSRCPLQAECERKCTYEGHEMDCDYYSLNGVGSSTIEDQEVIREERARKRQEEIDAEYYRGDTDWDYIPGEIVRLPIECLHPHPDNPRKELGDLTEIADSIRAKGVFQNLTVVMQEQEDGRLLEDHNYTIIIGHRRRAASELAGLTHIPCVIVAMTPKEQVETMLLENMQREDLTPYEQAQGFQMMLDMGDTVDGIVQKTGFSKKTVKRRLKMAELDQTVLKEVSTRQISMEDFDTLAKIDDIKQRNECLQNIGTPNFAIEVKKKIKKQNIAKNIPWVKKAIRLLAAKKITYSQTYYGDYRQIGDDIQIDELKDESLPVPDPGEKKLYYYMDEDTGRLRFFIEREKAAPVRRPQEEIDREKAQAEANEKCTELSTLFHKLRSDFVKTLTLNSKNQDAMLNGAARAIISAGFKYAGVSSTQLCSILGEERKWESGEEKRVTDLLIANPTNTFPGIIYAAFCDKDNEVYHSTYKKQFPRHSPNSRLDALYAWLTSVGYIMSDEEVSMQNGSHELLHLGKHEG